ncbi:MAG: sigma-70 family RNA polymerase sigma factor [Acidobacteriota bacterium]
MLFASDASSLSAHRSHDGEPPVRSSRSPTSPESTEGARRQAFLEACADAGVPSELRAPLERLLEDVPVGSQHSNRLEWLMEDFAHWQLYQRSREGCSLSARRFERHWSRVVMKFVGPRLSPSDREDFAASFLQVVFGRVARSFRWQAPFRAYLRQVMINCWRDELERRQRRERRELSLESEDGTLDIPDRAPSAERHLRAREQARVIEEAMAKLSLLDRRVVVARWLEGQSVQLLARELGMSPGALSQRLLRAKQALRAALAPT